MIEKIRMRECATYDADGIEINECKKINFIYGANGSGKSTISNFFQDTNNEDYNKCEVVWKNGVESEVAVYNRRFREKNFSTDGSAIEGIFTLGEATIDDIRKLDKLKEELKVREEGLAGDKRSLKKKRDEKQQREEQFKDDIWKAILKKYENNFGEAFSGLRKNKGLFKEEVVNRYKKGFVNLSTFEELVNRAFTLYSEKPETCTVSQLSIKLLLEEIYLIENDSIWKKVIVGNKDIPIARLIDKLNSGDWVEKGRNYIGNDGICPFCQQQTITKAFIGQVNQFFSGEYDKDKVEIENKKKYYEEVFEKIRKQLEGILLNSSYVTVGKLNKEAFQDKINLIDAIYKSNLSIIETKRKELSRSVVLQSMKSVGSELEDLVVIALKNIKEHNRMVTNYKAEQASLSNDVWAFVLDEQRALIDSYMSDIKNIDAAIYGISNKIKSLETTVIKELKDKIYEAGKNITSVQPAVDEINSSLKIYGFENFKIIPSQIQDNAYQIQRPDGTIVANTLSEGEETFISFLYFLQLVKGSFDKSKVSEKKILIIDDPICSLDSTVLYIVSTMIHDLKEKIIKNICDVEQMFILTHNVFFHKEASFVNGRISEENNVHFWILSKDNNISNIRSYGMENPIKTSYELLWKELKDNENASIITVQNTMRRIIENYFGMFGNGKYDKIINSFDTVEEQITCKSLFYWINDGSHTIPDDLYVDSYTDAFQKYKNVFKQIFIKTENLAHYNMMMGIVDEE